MNIKEIESYISKIPDYPKPGILFYDISSLIYNEKAFSASIEVLKKAIKNYKFDIIAAIDARGFIFGSALALSFGVGLVMIRKHNKLPNKTFSYEYDLEYGKDILEINQELQNKSCLIIDDLLATGGTGSAAVELIKKSKGDVCCFATLIELNFLEGRKKFDIPVESIIQY